MNIDIRDRNTQIGIGLVIVGILALFGNMGWFVGFGRLVGLAMFVAAGALVLRLYADDPGRVWALPVGFGLFGLALAVLDLPWSGGAFLGAVGLGFLAVFVVERHRWWSILPGGILLTIGLTAIYDRWSAPGADAGVPIFFLGLAATFAALYLLPSVQQRWALWPAVGLAVVGVLSIGFQGGWVLPVVLIGVGAWMLSRRSREPESPPTPRTGDGGPVGGAGSPDGGDGGGAAGTGFDEPTSPVDAAVRTPAQTPGPGAVQPSPRPETPDQAARRGTGRPDPGTTPAPTDVPPYGQEPVDWTRTGRPDGGDSGGAEEGAGRSGSGDGEEDRSG